MGEVGEGSDFEGEFAMIMANQSEEDDDQLGRVSDWVMGLPMASELPPLNQSLVPPELASAFQIPPEPGRSAMDVTRASSNTFSSLRRNSVLISNSNFTPFSPFNPSSHAAPNHTASAKADDADSTGGADDPDQDQSARTVKRSRLVWTPQLHKRFVDVVSHLGLKNAVPKTIMQLMNVEGLTRENVASHLQKYRLYVKRMAGLSSEGPASPSDNSLFASTPVPQSFTRESPQVPVPMSYAAVSGMYPIPVFGMGQNHQVNGHGHMGMGMCMGMGMMPITGGSHGSGAYGSGSGAYGNGFGPGASYPHHVNHGDK